ncbi:MAG: hypothetical protein R2799_15315 [Crocinitomicaceae bacterium]
MKEKISAEKIACTAIVKAIEMLRKENVQITSMDIRDYHFHELEIHTEKIDQSLIENLLSIENLQQNEDGVIFCSCHWSTIRF